MDIIYFYLVCFGIFFNQRPKIVTRKSKKNELQSNMNQTGVKYISCEETLVIYKRGLTSLVLVVISFSFLCIKLHQFIEEYNNLAEKQNNEMWLVEKCNSDEFYHNMKHHSKLCDDVIHRSRDSISLHAMRTVIENSFLCGAYSCESIMKFAFEVFIRNGFYIVIGTIVTISFFMTCLLPYWRRLYAVKNNAVNYALFSESFSGNELRAYDQRRMNDLHNTPYGLKHYQNTDIPSIVLTPSGQITHRYSSLN